MVNRMSSPKLICLWVINALIKIFRYLR